MNRSLLIGVLLVTAVHAFDELVLVVAMPVIAADLGAQGQYGLIIASYVLASIVGMNWAGREMDRRGPLPVFLTAMVLFVIGLLLAASAANTLAFVVARVLQGIGGGMGWTLTFGLISLLAPTEEKPRAVAAMDVAWVIPSLMAPLIGGVLVDYFNWRWVFLIQLLPVAAALVLIWPRIRGMGGDGRAADPWLLMRSIRIAVGVGVLLYCLGTAPSALWLLALPALWLMWKPFALSMPERWWQLSTPLSLSLMIALLAFLAFYAMEAYQPLYLIDVRGVSTMQAGMVLTCASVFWMLGSQAAARDWLRRGYQRRLLLGFTMIGIGIASMGVMVFLDWSAHWAYPSWCFTGLGMGITFNTCRSTSMLNTPPGQEGVIGGSVNLSISLGLSLATGFGGAIKNHTAMMGGSLNLAIQGIWLLSVAVAVFACLLLCYSLRRRD